MNVDPNIPINLSDEDALCPSNLRDTTDLDQVTHELHFNSSGESDLQQTALFGEMTYTLLDRFDLTEGLHRQPGKVLHSYPAYPRMGSVHPPGKGLLRHSATAFAPACRVHLPPVSGPCIPVLPTPDRQPEPDYNYNGYPTGRPR